MIGKTAVFFYLEVDQSSWNPQNIEEPNELPTMCNCSSFGEIYVIHRDRRMHTRTHMVQIIKKHYAQWAFRRH